MFSEALLAVAFQVLPFYEQDPARDLYAVRPVWSHEQETTDVLWPLFTSHRDWWRALFFLHGQTNDAGWQVDLLPFFWWGREGETTYGGLFPVYGNHPHFLFLHDVSFALWPLWMRYEMPRAAPREHARDECPRLRTHAVLWPFIHWRDDGSWGFFPFYVLNQARASRHETALWPLVTWASYEEDRDTAGAGSSWMVFPLYGRVDRAREEQQLFLPPLFSYAKTWNRGVPRDGEPTGFRLRAPWPLFEYEATTRRDHLSVFPFYEKTTLKSYSREDGQSVETSNLWRFGWKLVELYPDETRVFPFWVSRPDGAYFRLWPFWEASRTADGVTYSRFLSLFPIRHVPAVDRNWAKFWTLYESAEKDGETVHSLFWGIIRWRTQR